MLKNTLLFLVFSYAYYHITQALFAQVSALEADFLWQNILNSKILIGLGLLTMLQIWQAKKISVFFMAVIFGWIFLASFRMFLINFDKILLLLSFVYLVFAFYYLIFWKLELEDASYHPKFDLNDIKLRSTYEVDVELKLESGELYTGRISNLDENSCFILLDEKWDELRGMLDVKVLFEGDEFECSGQVVGRYGPGIGLKFNSKASEMNSTFLGWRDFYDIMSDRGYIQNTI